MRRGIASLWHASSLVIAGVLYFLFVLPRWFELTGQWPTALGTAMRLVCGVLVGSTALPVVLTLRRTRRPELGTPTLALQLRVWSIAAQVAAALLILGAAISEIWLDLDDAGQWLFGIYGAAAAIALLGAFASYLAFVAELPPPPPKPLTSSKTSTGTEPKNRRDTADVVDQAGQADVVDQTDEPESDDSDSEESDSQESDSQKSDSVEPDGAGSPPEAAETEPATGKLRNHRPDGKTRRVGRRSGVATKD